MVQSYVIWLLRNREQCEPMGLFNMLIELDLKWKIGGIFLNKEDTIINSQQKEQKNKIENESFHMCSEYNRLQWNSSATIWNGDISLCRNLIKTRWIIFAFISRHVLAINCLSVAIVVKESDANRNK